MGSLAQENIFRKFIPEGNIFSIATYGSGHINDTFLVKTAGQDVDYILQRVNRNIFKDISGIMENIAVVTDHISSRLKDIPGHDAYRETLNLVKTPGGNSFILDEEGGYWRVFLFIPGMVIHQAAKNPEMAREAGRLIGFFQRLLEDLEKPVKDTLPGFHSVYRRAGEYREAFVADPKERIIGVKDDIFFVENRLDRMMNYFDSFQLQNIPLRVAHYDTKINNVLFDENGKAMCLIDLDTLCPGYVHFDYGDALRTLTNTAAEDEKDLSKVLFNVPFFEAFTQGYLSEANYFLTDTERRLLPYAPIYLTFIIGLRFLTDYLNGDTYYKIKYPEHNLVRARVQFKLVTEMEMFLVL
jgi:hypothetical protein